MCGIIGINSSRPVSSTIINSLKKLEYRGYDSAGIATLSNNEIGGHDENTVCSLAIFRCKIDIEFGIHTNPKRQAFDGVIPEIFCH